MGDIVSIHEKVSNYKFFLLPIWIDYVIRSNDKVEERKHVALIALKNTENDTYIIHHLSNFIIDKWGFKSFNAQKKHALNIVKFLNYLLENHIRCKITNLSDLTIEHGTIYLTWLGTTGVKQETVKDAERTLVHFYIWGHKKSIFKKFSLLDFEESSNQYNKKYSISPFKVIYPAKKPKEVEHILPFELIPLFLDIACLHAPRIALGIYLQIFGGLRVSEIVNLKRTQVSKTLNTGEFIIKVETQNFRTDLTEHTSVKKTRTQSILDINGWGTSLLKDHLQCFPTNKTNAIFINTKGEALSGRSYRQYFEKCKAKLIRSLEESSKIEHRLTAQHLKTIKWSTHIGRGTFTNLIANEAQNPYEIAHFRGDSSLDSALTYMVSTPRMHEKIEGKLADMYKSYIPKLIERNSYEHD